MYQIDSGYQWDSSALLEGKVVALPLKQEAPDCDSGAPAQQGVSALKKLPNDCEVGGEGKVTKIASEQQLEQLLSNLLKYGVVIASAIVLVGGVLYLIRYGAEPADYQFFRGEPSEFRSPVGVVWAVFSGSRRGIIQLGLLLLVATPIARVAISLLTFLRQRDFTYVTLTLFVLAGLIYSLIRAYLH